MKQDPAYLENESRRLHALLRRNRRFLNWSALLWAVFSTATFLIAAIDRTAALGWGYSDDLSAFFGFAVFAPCFWIFATLIQKLILAYVRHTYGAEPTD